MSLRPSGGPRRERSREPSGELRREPSRERSGGPGREPGGESGHQPSGGAETWWGRAWIEAVRSAALDQGRLARGRIYARGGHVAELSVAPGRITARVRGSRPRPYRAAVRLDVLTAADWDRFLDVVADRPACIDALLARSLPRSLAEAAARAGVPLLPTAGEILPSCSCPDRGHPCKHSAALCYEAARLIDDDPFVLLLMRGRDERRLLDELARRTTELPDRRDVPAAPRGITARIALAPRTLPPLPEPLPVPPHPDRPSALPPTTGLPIEAAALEFLAADAAGRAHAALTTGVAPLPHLSRWHDTVRLASSRPTSGLTSTTRTLYRNLAAANGRTPVDVARAVAAWRQGGELGLTLLESRWNPPAGDFDRARGTLIAAGLPRLRPRANHLTDEAGRLQLRFGPDGRWYPYESDPGTDDWWPAGPPATDPVDALTALLDATRD